MKTNYTAEIKGHPETSTASDYNVTGDETTTHRDLAERAAVSAAMIIAEPSAEGWWGGEGENEYIADTELGSKHHTIRADLKGKAWGEHWSGTVTLDGKRYTVNVW